MAEPPELWAFLLTNVAAFVFSGLLTALSFAAYRRYDGNPSYRLAAIGFGLITFGGLVEPVYELAIRGSYELPGREMLAVHAVEGLLIAVGFGVLLYSISRYRRRPPTTAVRE